VTFQVLIKSQRGVSNRDALRIRMPKAVAMVIDTSLKILHTLDFNLGNRQCCMICNNPPIPVPGSSAR
jgi:hypothetical protein